MYEPYDKEKEKVSRPLVCDGIDLPFFRSSVDPLMTCVLGLTDRPIFPFTLPEMVA